MYEVMRGIRVLEFAEYVCAPVASAIMADWGADVIKVENPATGDCYRGLRNDFVVEGKPNPMLELPNRGKRSIGLNLKHPDGRALAHRLVASSDVLVTSFRSSTLARLGLDLESVRRLNPDIIFARSSGYGARGPEADRPGFDAAATWARAGFLHAMSSGADSAVLQPGSVGDLTGGLSLATGVACALLQRERTGVATEVDVSLYHVGLWIMAQSMGAAAVEIDPARTARSRTNPRNPLVNAYRTADGRWLMLCVLQSDRFWAGFCAHIDRSDLVGDPRFLTMVERERNTEQLVAILDAVFMGRTLAEWRDRLASFEGVWDPGLTPAEIVVDPQVSANGYFAEVVPQSGASFPAVAAPVQFGGRSLGEVPAMPEVAQHTEDILLELGLSWEEIGDLKLAGATT